MSSLRRRGDKNTEDLIDERKGRTDQDKWKKQMTLQQQKNIHMSTSRACCNNSKRLPLPYLHMGRVKRKRAFEHAQNAQIQVILCMRKASSGLLLFIWHSVESNDSFSGKRRSWSDCADAQSDLGLRCPHVPEDKFRMSQSVFYNAFLIFHIKVLNRIDWLCWGLTTRQPLWVILCRLPEKGSTTRNYRTTGTVTQVIDIPI